MSDIRSTYTDACSFYGHNTPRSLVEKWGTPLYVYNEDILRKRCRELKALSSFKQFNVNYSIKANANPALLRIIREEGLVVDAMSPGELLMDELAGFTRDEILYISNNNAEEELREAVSRSRLVSVDSLSQLDTLGKIVPGGKVMVRFNPGIGAGHHVKVVTAGKETKFGISPDDIEEIFRLLAKYHLVLAGVNQHIGSLFMEPQKYLAAADVLLRLVEKLPATWRHDLEIIDFGGGFGIPYHKYDHQSRLDMTDLGTKLHSLITEWAKRHDYSGQFFVEPGRYVVAECGILLGRVHAIKNNGEKCYVGTDIGFNVLVRPVMYDAFHDIEIYGMAVEKERSFTSQNIVGNICESGDILAGERLLPTIQKDDILGVLDAGAYGFTMSSNYNQRLRPAEILIAQDGSAHCIRHRETFEDLTRCFATL